MGERSMGVWEYESMGMSANHQRSSVIFSRNMNIFMKL